VELRSDIESKDFQICKASTPWKSNKPKKLAKVLGGEEQFEGTRIYDYSRGKCASVKGN
jgi:hypothetical protein